MSATHSGMSHLKTIKKGPSETLIETALSHRCSRSAVIVKQFMVAVNCMISKPTRNPIQENW